MQKHHHSRSTFSGKIGFVLSAAGASVGLGNIWRFPYLAAKYGGGIFLLIYILLALTFGYTMIVAETSIGRMTGKSPVGAFQSFGKSRWLSAGGWLNAVIPILIVPYYSVIGGWVIKYLVEYLATRWRPTAISARSSPTACPPSCASSSSRWRRCLSSMRACATALSASPG